MTHDELLALINKNAEDCEPDCYDHDPANKLWLAIRAVVELHKPVIVLTDDPVIVCSHCESIDYPCPTIQSIERKLA